MSIGGVLLHHSVLLLHSHDVNDDHSPLLIPGAQFLFRSLHFSQLHTGVCYDDNLSSEKVNYLKAMAKQFSFDCFSFGSSLEACSDAISSAWADKPGTLCVISSQKSDICQKLCDFGLSLAVLDVDEVGDTNKHPNMHHIKKLEEVPLIICRLNKKEAHNDVVTVGYSMKFSRQVDFAKRGALPLYSSEHGLMFLPLTYELPMPLQLHEIDVVLHKATDDIISIELNASGVAPKITYTKGMEELRRTLTDRSGCCVIDPFDNIYPVLDRLQIQYVLLGLEDLNKQGCSKIRGPHFYKVDNFGEPNLENRLLETKLSPPSIVKPQVACGVSNAHSMAIVFNFEDLKNLQVPLPAIIQEYVDHSSTLFKFYVLGEEIFHAVKKSTPNSDVLVKSSQANQLKPLVFDSLKSLPTADKNQFGDEALDLELVHNAANWLRQKLQLTIFGFDVVVQEGTGDHVIVDVNYLPSFKEVPDHIAIPAFWKAIKNKFIQKRESSSLR